MNNSLDNSMIHVRTYVKKTNIELFSYSPKKFEQILEFDKITFDDLMYAL